MTAVKKELVLSTKQTLYLFLFLVLALGLLGWRSESNAAAIRTNTHLVCESAATAIVQINGQSTAIVAALNDIQPRTAARDVLINIYRQTALDVPKC